MLKFVRVINKLQIITPCGRLNFPTRLLSSSSVEPKKENSLEFNNNYTANQVSKILETINNRSEIELTLFNISKSRVKKISTRKLKQGNFSSLEDVLELDGFGIKVLETFCDSILSSLQKAEPKKQTANEEKKEADEESLILLSRKKQSYVTPIINDSFRQTITSCVSFHLDLNCIAWTKMSLDENSAIGDSRAILINDWMCYEIGKEDKKLSLSELVQVILQLSYDIPEADSYVIEAMHQPQIAKQPGNPVHMNINVQRSQLFAMLCVLMASRDNKLVIPDPQEERQAKQQTRMFLLRSYLASRLFKVYVGREKVSTDAVINNILSGNMENQPRHLILNPIDVPTDLKSQYEDCSKIEKEYLGQSMLVGLTFLKLCILKCSKSMTALNKRT